MRFVSAREEEARGWVGWRQTICWKREKKKKVVKHSAQIKMSVRPTQFICVRLIKGDSSH